MKIEKDFKGRNSVLNEVVSRHFPEGTGENQGKLQTGKPVTRPRFELRAYRLHVYSVTSTPACSAPK
jgi:hypothetical protein